MHKNDWSQLCFAGSGHVTRGSGLKVSDRSGRGGEAFDNNTVRGQRSTTRGQNMPVGSRRTPLLRIFYSVLCAVVRWLSQVMSQFSSLELDTWVIMWGGLYPNNFKFM